MGSDNSELVEEIKRLREELNQMREVVNMLLTVVMDDQEEGEEYDSVFMHDDPGRRLNLYN
ncbi:MAG TPA: hypothetical protein VMW02_03395 [Thermoplasmata archaeon]|nr:hypothetical protein [Thermoplasmata archaeon]